MSKQKIFWLHALNPIHIGTGQGVGFIDLPILREKTTNWPLIPGSSFKGVLRDQFPGDAETIRKAFGDDKQAGSLVFSDARLVCLPIRSYCGTYAYVTCPLALKRLKRDLGVGNPFDSLSTEFPLIDTQILTTQTSQITYENSIYLEDLDFTAQPSPEADQWADTLASSLFPNDSTWSTLFVQRFAIVPDKTFDYFCETGTEVQTHIRIEDGKAVANQALWYEESLPTETILAGVIWNDRFFDALHLLPENLQLQIGGKATVGKGQVRCLFAKKEA